MDPAIEEDSITESSSSSTANIKDRRGVGGSGKKEKSGSKKEKNKEKKEKEGKDPKIKTMKSSNKRNSGIFSSLSKKNDRIVPEKYPFPPALVSSLSSSVKALPVTTTTTTTTTTASTTADVPEINLAESNGGEALQTDTGSDLHRHDGQNESERSERIVKENGEPTLEKESYKSYKSDNHGVTGQYGYRRRLRPYWPERVRDDYDYNNKDGGKDDDDDDDDDYDDKDRNMEGEEGDVLTQLIRYTVEMSQYNANVLTEIGLLKTLITDAVLPLGKSCQSISSSVERLLSSPDFRVTTMIHDGDGGMVHPRASEISPSAQDELTSLLKSFVENTKKYDDFREKICEKDALIAKYQKRIAEDSEELNRLKRAHSKKRQAVDKERLAMLENARNRNKDLQQHMKHVRQRQQQQQGGGGGGSEDLEETSHSADSNKSK